MKYEYPLAIALNLRCGWTSPQGFQKGDLPNDALILAYRMPESK